MRAKRRGKDVQLVVRRYGNLLDVSLDGQSPAPESVVSLLAPSMTYTYKQLLRGAEAYDPVTGRHTAVRLESRRLWCLEEGRFTCGAGYLARVAHLLQQAGHDARFIDVTPRHPRADRYTLNWAAVHAAIQFRPRQQECIERIVSNPCGIIKATMGFGKTELLRIIATLFPKAKIHIVVRSVDLAEKIVRGLTRYIPDVGQIGGGVQRWGRVTVITADSLHLSDGDADILLGEECVTGDAQIATPTGVVALRDVRCGQEVLCYNGTTVVQSRVTRTWAKGPRLTLRLTTASGKTIQCTANHPILTVRGWVPAGELNTQDKIVCLAPVDVEPCSAEMRGVGNKYLSSATTTGFDHGLGRSGENSGMSYALRCLSVLAGVVSVCRLVTAKLWTSLSEDAAINHIAVLSSDMQAGLKSTDSGSISLNAKPSSAPCLVTLPLTTRITGVKTHDSSQTTVVRKSRGLDTKLLRCIGSAPQSLFTRIADLGRRLCTITRGVCRHLFPYLVLFALVVVQSELHRCFWINSAGSDWRGGFVTTAVATGILCIYILKVLTGFQWSVLLPGLRGISGQRLFGGRQIASESIAAGTYPSPAAAATRFAPSSTAISPTAWRTSVEPLTTIEQLVDAAEVFDIEVEGCHNFFANGLLVHNCHQLGAPAYAEPLSALYRWSRNYGLSATPFGRMDGSSARLEPLFGPVIFELLYPEAVSLGLVVPIKVRWLDCQMDVNPAKGKTGVSRKRWAVWRNGYRNGVIASAVREYTADQQVLCLVETIEHAVHLWQQLPEFALCYGNMDASDFAGYRKQELLPADFIPMSPDRRIWMREAFERNELKKVIATDVWATGVSFDQLSVLARCDDRDSAVLNDQGPGRVSRIYTNEAGTQKAFGTVLDVIDHFDKSLKTKSRGRYHSYEAMGWEQDWPKGKRQFSQAEGM